MNKGGITMQVLLLAGPGPETSGADRIVFPVDYPFIPAERPDAFLQRLPMLPADRERIA